MGPLSTSTTQQQYLPALSHDGMSANDDLVDTAHHSVHVGVWNQGHRDAHLCQALGQVLALKTQYSSMETPLKELINSTLS